MHNAFTHVSSDFVLDGVQLQQLKDVVKFNSHQVN